MFRSYSQLLVVTQDSELVIQTAKTNKNNRAYLEVENNKNLLRRIGQGFCATVWAPEQQGDAYALKREDGGPERSVHNDFIIYDKLRGTPLASSRAIVPECHKFIHHNDRAWWGTHITDFPSNFRVPCNALVMDCIPPFPRAIRERLIDLYYPESLIPTIKASPENTDCLVRPYLGRRRRLEKQSTFKPFSLRNYRLHLDQIEELNLDGTLYAEIMAETLAGLYWTVHVDANDVEFVLAPLKNEETMRGKAIMSEHLGEHGLWIVDFDCCRDMTIDDKGVEQAVTAFCKNDPYFPRPYRNDVRDQALWTAFEKKFLEASDVILGRDGPQADLPRLWSELVKERGK